MICSYPVKKYNSGYIDTKHMSIFYQFLKSYLFASVNFTRKQSHLLLRYSRKLENAKDKVNYEDSIERVKQAEYYFTSFSHTYPKSNVEFSFILTL